MNTFGLLTFMGALGVVVSFFSGARAMLRHGGNGYTAGRRTIAWRMVFDLTVFVTILAAPLAA
jgi:hypothetical protein